MNFSSVFDPNGRTLLARILLFVALMSGPAARALPGYEGPVPPPSDAYGARGPFDVTTDVFERHDGSGFDVTVYHPKTGKGPWPTWFFAHGFSGGVPAYYGELLTHLASHGATVVFSPYPNELTNVAQNLTMLFEGFTEAADRFPDLIDTTRVAFAGHSYGAGAVPALALRAVRERGWGDRGLALLLLAPWYSYGVSDADLASFPAHTLAVVEIYEDDMMNDHRMAIDVFNHLGMPARNKDFLMVRSDRIDGYNYYASHRVPTGKDTPGADSAFNALDAWGVHRIAQALADAAWRFDPQARAIALGHGSADQVLMGTTPAGRPLRPMTESRKPVPLFPSDRYIQPWDGILNPRSGETLPAPLQRPHLANLSARAFSASGGDELVAGATIAGPRPKSLVVRAVGPGLEQFGVKNPLPNPRLAIDRGARHDLEIDDWGQASIDVLQEATAETGAFDLAEGSLDAAILGSFSPGDLTVHASPTGDASGVALLEIYDADDDDGAFLSGISARARVSDGDKVLVAGFVVADGQLPLLIRALGPALIRQGVPAAMTDPQLEIYQDDRLVATNDDWSADPRQKKAIGAAARTIGLPALDSGSKDAGVLLTLPVGVYTAVVRARGAAGIGAVEVYQVTGIRRTFDPAGGHPRRR